MPSNSIFLQNIVKISICKNKYFTVYFSTLQNFCYPTNCKIDQVCFDFLLLVTLEGVLIDYHQRIKEFVLCWIFFIDLKRVICDGRVMFNRMFHLSIKLPRALPSIIVLRCFQP